MLDALRRECIPISNGVVRKKQVRRNLMHVVLRVADRRFQIVRDTLFGQRHAVCPRKEVRERVMQVGWNSSFS